MPARALDRHAEVDAQHDFLRARRLAAMARLVARLLGEPAESAGS